jgi:L-amino acid N-acyltransferase YncA
VTQLEIRRAGDEDWPAIWPIWHEVVAAGETYTWDPETGEAAARALWMPPPPAETWVAVDGQTIVGTAVLKPNQSALGAHIANGSFMVPATSGGRGIGRRLAEQVIARAGASGYRGMQFNAVVSTNEPAVALWKSLGFAIVGTIPGGFRHARLGYVDLHIMYRELP